VYPRELYCAHCSQRLSEAPETLLLPPEAGRFSSAAGMILDLLGVVLLVGSQLWALPTFWSLLIGILAGLTYRALARAHGRQSFGQAVFHLLTVARDAGPASYAVCARRTLLEVAWLPSSVLSGRGALARLDDLSGSYEVCLD
jgi:hypothetical protein